MVHFAHAEPSFVEFLDSGASAKSKLYISLPLFRALADGVNKTYALLVKHNLSGIELYFRVSDVPTTRALGVAFAKEFVKNVNFSLILRFSEGQPPTPVPEVLSNVFAVHVDTANLVTSATFLNNFNDSSGTPRIYTELTRIKDLIKPENKLCYSLTLFAMDSTNG